MSGTCKDCRWWAQQEPDSSLPRFHKCLSPKIIRGYRDVDVPDDGANVEDDEGWGIVTGPDFGCVQFEVKP